jgi:triosephosphate isomerase
MPEKVAVNVRCSKGPREGQKFSYEITLGETAAESIQMFGDDVVNHGFIKSAVIACANPVRLAMQAGKTDEELAKMCKEYKPGITMRAPRVAKDPVAAIIAKATAGEMDPEAIQTLIQQLRGLLKK